MITTGLTLALLTGAAFYMIFIKLPKRVRVFMQKHPLLTDAVACLLTYMLFGGTLVALFSAAWLGLIISTILALTSNPTTNAMLERLGNKMNAMKDSCVDFIAVHSEAYLEKNPQSKPAEQNGQ